LDESTAMLAAPAACARAGCPGGNSHTGPARPCGLCAMAQRPTMGPMNAVVDAPALDLGWNWQNRFAALGEAFFTRTPPTPLPEPHWVATQPALARELGLDAAWLGHPEALQALSGNRALAGSAPLASVYSGHQFGVWAGQLGDGRAILLGEVDTPAGPM